MSKALVLQRLHGLADDATSFQITDRHTFRAFLGLTPSDLVPDRQTIADFREVLIAANAFESLFGVFLTRLQKQCGLALAKQGVMVDASFADSAYSDPPPPSKPFYPPGKSPARSTKKAPAPTPSANSKKPAIGKNPRPAREWSTYSRK